MNTKKNQTSLPTKELAKIQIKTAGLGIAIGIGVNFTGIIIMKSDHGFFISFVLGMIGMFMANMIMMKQDKRLDMAKKAWRWVIYRSRMVTGIIICAVFFTLIGFEKPNDPTVMQFYRMIDLFGKVGFIALVTMLVVRVMFNGRYDAFIRRSLSAMVSVLFLLAVVGKVGDPVYAWFNNDTEAAILTISAGLAAFWVIRFSQRCFDTGSHIERVQFPSAIAPISKMISPGERSLIAAHEAGHALVFAAIKSLPDNFRVEIKDRYDHTGTLGQVYCELLSIDVETKRHAEWRMLMLLAGKFGEAFMFNENTMGSTSDSGKWTGAAKQYLCNHFAGVYYTEPETTLEQASNKEALDSLVKSQWAMLDSFFTQNVDVFNAIHNGLIKNSVMKKEEIQPLLAKVTFPEGFPLI